MAEKIKMRAWSLAFNGRAVSYPSNSKTLRCCQVPIAKLILASKDAY